MRRGAAFLVTAEEGSLSAAARALGLAQPTLGRQVDALEVDRAELIIRKGFRSEIDSYSAFFENDRRTPTGLAGYLRDRGLRRIFIVGLATDFCVHYSAVDARRLRFDTVLVAAGCRAIDLAGSLDAAWTGMAAVGVQRICDL